MSSTRSSSAGSRSSTSSTSSCLACSSRAWCCSPTSCRRRVRGGGGPTPGARLAAGPASPGAPSSRRPEVHGVHQRPAGPDSLPVPDRAEDPRNVAERPDAGQVAARRGTHVCGWGRGRGGAAEPRGGARRGWGGATAARHREPLGRLGPPGLYSSVGRSWGGGGFSGPLSSALLLDATLRSPEYLCRGQAGSVPPTSPAAPGPQLLPASFPVLNSPVPRPPRDPAGAPTAAGGRWSPAGPAHTGTATPPAAPGGPLRPPQPRLSEPPSLPPGLPGPALRPGPRRLGPGPGFRRRRPVAALPAGATGLRSAVGVRELAGAQGPLPPLPRRLPPLPRRLPAPRQPPRPTSNKVAPKLTTLAAASFSTSPRVGLGAGGPCGSRGWRDSSSRKLCSRYSWAAATASSREDRSGGCRATWARSGGGGAGGSPGGAPRGARPGRGRRRSLTSVELWKW